MKYWSTLNSYEHNVSTFYAASSSSSAAAVPSSSTAVSGWSGCPGGVHFTDERCQLVMERLNLAMVAGIALLHVDHHSSQERALSHMISHVGEHGLQQSHALRIPRARHGDTNSHAARVSHVGVSSPAGDEPNRARAWESCATPTPTR